MVKIHLRIDPQATILRRNMSPLRHSQKLARVVFAPTDLLPRTIPTQSDAPMSSTAAFLASFISILIGAAIGMLLKRSARAELLEGGAKEVVRLGAGFLATLAALVIGLMIASAKNSYDTQNTNIRQLGTNAVLVDQMLLKYGPAAREARTLLREIIPSATARIWQENLAARGGSNFVVSSTGERFYDAIEGLKPANEEQTSLKARIIQITTEMGRTRLLVFTQNENAIPVPFFVVLVFWLVLIFASFSLFAEPGPIVIASTLLFALSVSSALFLIVDLGHPFEGLMQISNHHLQVVLPKIE